MLADGFGDRGDTVFMELSGAVVERVAASGAAGTLARCKSLSDRLCGSAGVMPDPFGIVMGAGEAAAAGGTLGTGGSCFRVTNVTERSSAARSVTNHRVMTPLAVAA